jgi:hypothetical protein
MTITKTVEKFAKNAQRNGINKNGMGTCTVSSLLLVVIQLGKCYLSTCMKVQYLHTGQDPGHTTVVTNSGY